MNDTTRCQTIGYARLVPVLAAAAALAISGLVRPLLAETNAPYIGMNFCPFSDGDPIKLFADVVKNSRGFGTYDDPHEFATVDENGWPLTDAGVVVLGNIRYANGTYRLYFTTQDPAVDARTVTVSFDWGSASLGAQSYDAASNTVQYDVTVSTTGNALLMIKFRDTNGGVKNVKFMRPISPGSTTSYDTSVTFNAQAIEFLRHFSVLRFMQVVYTFVGNDVAEWADRTPPTYACQQARYFGGVPSEPGANPSAGVAWEYLIQLCNEVDADIFVNVPFLATDDYVRQLALLLQANLEPERKIYVEYSNELWNFAYPYDAGRNHDSAVAEVNRGGSPLNFDGEDNEWYWGWRRTAKRGKEISAIFRSVFGDGQMMSRVRPLLMNQLDNGQNTLGTGLLLMHGYYNNPEFVADPHPPKYYFYGAGGAPYYGPTGSFDINSAWSSGSMDTSVFISEQLTRDTRLSAVFGLKHIAYEGGPELPQSTLGAEIWADSRMTQAMIDHHNCWSRHGGDLWVYFSAANWGSSDNRWSFIHYIEESNTPKMAAIDSLNAAQRAPLTYGPAAPVSIPGDSVAMSYAPFYDAPSRAQATEWYGYVFRVDTAGTYGVTVDVNAGGAGTLSLYADGELVSSPAIGSGAQTTQQFTVDLQPGLHGVIVKVATLASGQRVAISQVNITLEAIAPVADAGIRATQPSHASVSLTSGNLRIRVGSSRPSLRILRVCTLDGRTLVNRTIRPAEPSGMAKVAVPGLSRGMYVVRVSGMGTAPAVNY